jgi:hypothetical protein
MSEAHVVVRLIVTYCNAERFYGRDRPAMLMYILR